MTQGRGIHIEPLFGTPIIIDRPAIDRSDLARWIDSVMSAAPPTIGKRIALPGPIPLWAYLSGLATRITTSTTQPSRPIDWRVSTFLYIADRDASWPIEPHYDAFWHALYLVEESGSDNHIVLADPRLPAPMMEMPDLRLRLGSGTANVYAPEIALPLTGNAVFIIPGWMRPTWQSHRGAAYRSLLSMAITAPLTND